MGGGDTPIPLKGPDRVHGVCQRVPPCSVEKLIVFSRALYSRHLPSTMYGNQARATGVYHRSESSKRRATHSDCSRNRRRSVSPPRQGPRPVRSDPNLELLAPRYYENVSALNDEYIELQWLPHEATAFAGADQRTFTVPTAGGQLWNDFSTIQHRCARA